MWAGEMDIKGMSVSMFVSNPAGRVSLRRCMQRNKFIITEDLAATTGRFSRIVRFKEARHSSGTDWFPRMSNDTRDMFAYFTHSRYN
jgi:hypothetical protein